MSFWGIRPMQDGFACLRRTQCRVTSSWGIGFCLVSQVPCLCDASGVAGEKNNGVERKKRTLLPRKVNFGAGTDFSTASGSSSSKSAKALVRWSCCPGSGKTIFPESDFIKNKKQIWWSCSWKGNLLLIPKLRTFSTLRLSTWLG